MTSPVDGAPARESIDSEPRQQQDPSSLTDHQVAHLYETARRFRDATEARMRCSRKLHQDPARASEYVILVAAREDALAACAFALAGTFFTPTWFQAIEAQLEREFPDYPYSVSRPGEARPQVTT